MGASTPREVVFVVSDSHAERLALCGISERLGCQPVPLAGGDACLQELTRRVPDLILMDLRMEGLQGDETCRRVKENPAWRNVPVLLLTPASHPAEMMYCWRAAADDFLPRPVELAQVAAKLAAVRSAGAAPLPARPNGRTLLLVEDSRFYRTLIGGALEHEGFKVAYARDGHEARQLLAERGPEFSGFLCDVMLPDGTGWELAELIRATPPLKDRRILLVSAFGHSPDILARMARLSGATMLEKRQLPADVLVRRILLHFSPARTSLRASERAPFFSTVEFRTPGGETLSGFSYDASPGGLFVRTLTPAPEGSLLELRLRLASAPAPLEAEAVVAWANGYRRGGTLRAPVGMGLRFTTLPPSLSRQFPFTGTRPAEGGAGGV